MNSRITRSTNKPKQTKIISKSRQKVTKKIKKSRKSNKSKSSKRVKSDKQIQNKKQQQQLIKELIKELKKKKGIEGLSMEQGLVISLKYYQTQSTALRRLNEALTVLQEFGQVRKLKKQKRIILIQKYLKEGIAQLKKQKKQNQKRQKQIQTQKKSQHQNYIT